MRYMINYDLMETMRNTNQWLGASAQALGSYPAFSMIPNPAMEWMRAWGEVTERTFQRMVVKPDWAIPSVTGEDGKDHLVSIDVCVPGAFGDLIHFNVNGRAPRDRKVLVVMLVIWTRFKSHVTSVLVTVRCRGCVIAARW